MINAMLWILNTGSPWRDLPERYGPWQTAYNRFNRWQADGTFDAVLERLQIRLDAEGRIDWDLWCIDGSNVQAHVAAAGAGQKGNPTSLPTTHGPLARRLGHEAPPGLSVISSRNRSRRPQK